jgi:hypothetical protein
MEWPPGFVHFIGNYLSGEVEEKEGRTCSASEGNKTNIENSRWLKWKSAINWEYWERRREYNIEMNLKTQRKGMF